MSRRALIPLLLLALGAGAYLWDRDPETRRQVILRHAAEFEVIRKQLYEIAAVVPPPEKKDFAACGGISTGERPFHYDYDQPAASNTALVSYEQLRDPATTEGSWKIPSFSLAEYIAASSPDHQPTAADGYEADDEDVKEIEAMARVRYVVVIRVIDITPPSIYEISKPVLIDFDASIVELSTQKVLCTITTQAEAESAYLYSYTEGADKQQEKAEAYRDHISRAGSRILEERLNSLGRGTFDLYY